MSNSRNSLGLLGAALLGSITIANSAFALEPLPQGNQLTLAMASGEGKCGEGKCGESGKAGSSEGKSAEGKCGEGKCGSGDDAKS